MHELSFVADIVENVLQFAETRHVKKVLAVRVAVGELTRLEPEQMQFCYESIISNPNIGSQAVGGESWRAEEASRGLGSNQSSAVTVATEPTSILAGSKLEVEVLAARVRCSHCDYEGPPKYWDEALCAAPTPTLQCPCCGKQTEAVAGHECAIKSIKFVN